ncbi:class I SAM-dependent methyltransferase [Gleimia sp. 6138-11-ORH1]|uniref:class I SAM-dependent methyltransferase n=1 Tax=Gleimia sp. 6138-11-ORH1 TaxID=2973937 RepID=UPI00216A9FAD|nr:class I SAM-dependent methyltransferase [Gleimia sp. 6138-11-ORH1]MCS4484985.1 class I SAM-dependent methyltransferase [Gleimia sp. 6138-11-ORH1]
MRPEYCTLPVSRLHLVVMTQIPTELQLADELIPLLREELSVYTVENLVEVFSQEAYEAYQQEQRVALLHAVRQASGGGQTVATEEEKQTVEQLSVFSLLFLLGEAVEAQWLAQILHKVTIDDLVSVGLLCQEANQVWAKVKLEPHRVEFNEQQFNWWIASDFPSSVTGKPVEKDHVLGIGGATRTLLQATPRGQVKRVLDLGTGCGIIGMYAALHADEVIATDISARAVQIARFNATLNQVPMQVIQGSLFEPVEGDFDLILSNPPFVITPASLRETGVLEYRDGGLPADTLLEQVIQGAATRLRPNGVAIMLGNWEIPQGKTSEIHPRQWLTSQPVTAWVVQREKLTPHQYVQMWLRDNAPAWMRSQIDYETDYINWVSDFAARKVEAIGLGLVALVKPAEATNPTHFEFSEISTGISAHGSYIKRVLEELAENKLEIRNTDFFIRAEDVREERHYLPGEPDPQIIIATQGDGFGQRIQLNTHLAAALGACDGELNIGQIVTAISVITGVEHAVVETAVYGQLPQVILAGMLFRAK